MKKLAITTGAAFGALAAVYAWGAWVYEGQWGKFGSRNGEFNYPYAVAIAANGSTYVADSNNHRIQ
ncbi:MAG: hypothetical protein GTN49_09915 [candidate division Zixibacteria bacterium]|nr:hypothetical protein [candidate division Zixibacteria bacterium]